MTAYTDPLVCPLDGNLRRITAKDRYSTTYRCGWCGGITTEHLDPDPRNDLQRSFDRRDHR